VDRRALVLGTNSSLSGVVALPLPLALVGGGDAPELGEDDERDESDDPVWACECGCVGEFVGECGGESITLTRRAAYSLILALRVCRLCARAAPRESEETLRTCTEEMKTKKGHVSFGSRRQRERGGKERSKQTEDETKKPDTPRTHTPHGSTPRTN